MRKYLFVHKPLVIFISKIERTDRAQRNTFASY